MSSGVTAALYFLARNGSSFGGRFGSVAAGSR